MSDITLPPTVFISYSHDSPQHAERVLSLAEKLRSHGIDAQIDQYDPWPVEGWPQWMESRIRASRWVLVVCTEAYLKKWRGDVPADEGKRVKWEAQLLRNLLYGDSRLNHKCIPVVFDGEGDECVPSILKGSTVHRDVDTEAGYLSLYRQLTGQVAVKKPQLGEPLALPRRDAGPTHPSPPLQPTPASAAPTPLELAQQSYEEAIRDGLPSDIVEIRKNWMMELKRGRRGSRRTLQPGERLGGRYEIIKQLGRGGFSTVWRAYDVDEKRYVAVKVLHPDLMADQSRKERFLRGARTMASLDHPRIVRVYEAEGSADGLLYFVMEFVEGGTLHQAVIHGMSLAQRLEVIQQVAEGLAAAHAAGQVHRDVKPRNILLRADGTACLTDFDLVKAEDTTGMTRTGFLGTWAYAAPEAGIAAKDVDARADIYGLGMTLAFCLYGADLPHSVHRRWDAFVDGLEVSGALKALLHKATAWEREGRHQSVKELIAALGMAGKPGQPGAAGGYENLKAGTLRVIQLGGIDLELVWVPRGWFMMGGDVHDDEKPIHKVTFTQGFWLGRYPVINAQYAAFTGATSAPEPHHMGDRQLNAPDQPVVSVSWEDVGQFCDWATAVSGETVGRPTEAQWEYAARGPGERPRTYPWGEEAPTLELANFNPGGFKKRGAGRTTPVGRYPNGMAWCGALDMAGNVSEWCEDWQGSYSSSPQTDPTGPPEGSSRVLRGGSWLDDAGWLRGAFRGGFHPPLRDHDIGFRVVVAPSPGSAGGLSSAGRSVLS